MKELVKPNKIEEQAQKVEAFCEQSGGCICGCFAGSGYTSTEEEEEILF
jgi:hypothetical protein